MKKNIKEILNTVTYNTPIEDVVALCDTIEDLELILANLPQPETVTTTISDELKQAALNLCAENNLCVTEVTIAFIQKELRVGFSQAADIVEWLRTISLK